MTDFLPAPVTAALTPEQWAARALDDPRLGWRTAPDGALVADLDPSDTPIRVRIGPAALPGVMALANDALPHTAPNKITRADLDAIRTYAELASWVFDTPDADTQRVEAAYRRALAKLAALLPPDQV